MKKILISLLALAVAFPALAQDDISQKNPDIVKMAADFKEDVQEALKQQEGQEYSPLIAESEDGMFKLFSCSHVGYGVYSVKSFTPEFVPSLSGEFFINLLRFGFYPLENLSFELNLDFGHNTIKSTKSVLVLSDKREVMAIANGDYLPTGIKKPRSRVEYFSVNLPFLVKYSFGDFNVGVGTEVSLNLAGRATHKYSMDNDTFSVIEKKAGINRFAYAMVGALSYDDICLFVKFYPRYAGVLSNRYIDMRYMSIGLAFGL